MLRESEAVEEAEGCIYAWREDKAGTSNGLNREAGKVVAQNGRISAVTSPISGIEDKARE